MGKQFDVIICGCGPSGATAGTILARSGRSVLILDRARFPRKKLCGGLLTWKSIKLLEAVHGETIDSLTRQGIINFVSDHYAIRTFSNTISEGKSPFPFHFTDRTVFDAHLLKLTEKAGAEIREEARVLSCDPEQGTVTLEGGTVLQGHFVIGADGANSMVRAAFPDHDRKRFRRHMAPTIEISLDLADFPRTVAFPELYIGFLNAGYGWVFPNQDRVIVGMCGLRNKKESFLQIFKEYLDFLKIKSNTIPTLHGHPLPYGNYLHTPVFGNALLAGDAGGFVEPLLGEGIFFALCSGLYAGEAIAEAWPRQAHPGPLYLRKMHRQIIPELKASDKLRWLLFTAMRCTGTASLSLFVNSSSTRLAEMVHGIRSYSWLRKKQWDFLTPSSVPLPPSSKKYPSSIR